MTQIHQLNQLLIFALKEKAKFLILTDHDTIKGSQNLKEYVAENNYDIEVLIAANIALNMAM